ncbi:hypothetical protein SUGI_0979050 [Cryptomeria japonica]|uniref:galactinol--sucrose galactosyltransferase n=1 Tax=Cryptomeria japonica TaxID=3369 RepID=UPI002414A93B|nr:galactinol--sucrose galactosyltransferase [Cryptomeria japonica]GLJ46450.1 hypothetical protein SUGI_0979050 [Cryptomeria japonica]
MNSVIWTLTGFQKRYLDNLRYDLSAIEPRKIMKPQLKLQENGGSNKLSENLLNGEYCKDFIKQGSSGKENQSFALCEGKLLVHGLPFLFDVPPNIILTPYCSSGDCSGSFIGFEALEAKSRHVVSVGKFKGIRFVSIFRFKVWWSTPLVGNNGRDVESETQFVLFDKAAEHYPYVLILPIIEGKFRASLQGGSDDYVDVCVESCSSFVKESRFRSCIYVHAGYDPYDLIGEAMKVLEGHLGSFRLLKEKSLPPIVDRFGWCTWNAFYLKIKPKSVYKGVKEFVEGGCPLGFVIIDDGWQSICFNDSPVEEASDIAIAGHQMTCRLRTIAENYRFKDYISGSMGLKGVGGNDDRTIGENCKPNDDGEENYKPNDDGEENYEFKDQTSGCLRFSDGSDDDAKLSVNNNRGMAGLVRDLKAEFEHLQSVYVWHALCGYWGGVHPATTKFSSKETEVVLSEGLKKTMHDLAVDRLIDNGIAVVLSHEIHKFYDMFYSYLSGQGVDGVKTDVIHLLETICEEEGGRVEMNKAYFNALSEATRKYLGGNNVLASMEQCNDFMLLGTQAISLGRVGDDFWTEDPNGPYPRNPKDGFFLQGIHLLHCAYNSLWMGQFVHPDWDMFQSTHYSAYFHAASRAICGGPVYVSDSLSEHNFDLLRKLVLPDGTILRCCGYALPTRDCLFHNALEEQDCSILKIWNVNKYNGVVGTFNCQGGAWSREERRFKNTGIDQLQISSARVSPKDVEWKQNSETKANCKEENVEEFAVYQWKARELSIIKGNSSSTVSVLLKPLEFELITMIPVLKFSETVKWAPIGLLNMLNSGGAVQNIVASSSSSEIHGHVEIRGHGQMGLYSYVKPKRCTVNNCDMEFGYDEKQGLVVVEVPWRGSGLNSMLNLFF